ncbi:hypothetical protein LOZ61_002108 [Ophidiomyces ophidiicola]|uniref:Uncharacterized protein n=1 Tax=Ophidiomyces ophidiicola TaxID=1387563 RepID=A0ACB8V247_9EURO|nr:hypothetical protein LOZ61_002108 [Ophidiomyces ophidiicola]KAI1930931.1 hypothetical protein LOZ60_000591 [Ophidiomyces ophidiicola]KAI1962100.1 hypothetical protein LOZ59_002134 [Ophidiomyces ophidiicola]KAI1970796.1 hypothetical protein LOZ56_003442 [Ophidiomyces ophidiicola]KAI2032815.1 hypothetical protein LOZ48_002288 [Ophidiomyces ophidiicola]
MAAPIYIDPAIQRFLNDKLYDKRKQGALELERVIREAVINGDPARIRGIIDQLCRDYAYAVHQPHARNGGLIGLAAAAIALGSEEVAPYLTAIVPPVLACFTCQDARVRYYACESMYNIAKVAKGEILLYFNDVFDALCKLASDSELSIKNGAELLDRLVKDIVADSAASYVSVLEASKEGTDADGNENGLVESPTAFSLARFIPLLKERIHVISPFTRNFLVSWLTLLDTIPDLELVTYLPAFLAGLFKFLSDPNRDVHTATQSLLERFLGEIQKIAQIKKDIAESRGDRGARKSGDSVLSDSTSMSSDRTGGNENSDNAIADSVSGTVNDDQTINVYGDWIPGQDIHVDHPQILEILVGFVDTAFGIHEEIQLTALRWIDSFFEISPEDILRFVPRLLSQVLPALSSGSEQVCQAAGRVNNSLMQYIVSLPEDAANDFRSTPPQRTSTINSKDMNERMGTGRTPTPVSALPSRPQSTDILPKDSETLPDPTPSPDLDYAAAVNSLTLQFLNENEATRVAALTWLIMLHRKAPRKVLAFHDGTFPALLKTLSDPAEAVVTRDLQLLSQISRNSEDSYFTSFMVNLLQLFSTDRKLLEVRGNLIIRQLCMNLSPDRIYRTLADCLEKEEDIEFASIMVQNLNNNLITAPELADLRKRLRNLESKEGQTLFMVLFRSWCHNAVSTFSLCLLAQAYEQAYHLLQAFAELEMTVNMLIQIDKLVQLLESPVFTYLRLQLLEPERYPYLYKCLYGVLMLLPQSSAFAALKNRLNSVSNIGLLNPPKTTGIGGPPSTAGYERPTGRLKREDSVIRWVDLLDKFKVVQERSRRSRGLAQREFEPDKYSSIPAGLMSATLVDSNNGKEKTPPEASGGGTSGNASLPAGSGNRSGAGSEAVPPPKPAAHKTKSSLGNFGRLSGIGQRKLKK